MLRGSGAPVDAPARPAARGGPRQTLGGRWAASGRSRAPSHLWRDAKSLIDASPRLFHVVVLDLKVRHFCIIFGQFSGRVGRLVKFELWNLEAEI